MGRKHKHLPPPPPPPPQPQHSGGRCQTYPMKEKERHKHLPPPPPPPPPPQHSGGRCQTHPMEEKERPLLKKAKTMEEIDAYGGDMELMRRHKEALKSLIENRTKEVGHLKDINNDDISQLEHWRLRSMESSAMLEDAEERLRDASSKLAFLQCALVRVDSHLPIIPYPRVDASSAMLACPPPIPSQQSRRRLFIPAAQPPKDASMNKDTLKKQAKRRVSKWSTGNGVLFPCPIVKKEPLTFHSSLQHMDNFNKQNPGKHNQHQELISQVRSRSSADTLAFGFSRYIHSGHRRKLRCLALNPINKQLFLTSALDGVVSLWKLGETGETASVVGTRDCLSPLKKWPEEVIWHPDGETMFAAYSADGADSQISFLKRDLSPAIFLEEKPHKKGMINNITFMPWKELCFGTAGSDHAVVLWTAKKGSWIPNTIHRTEHTSAVMGVYGVQHKKMIVSVGFDKRLVGFDLTSGIAEFKHLIDSKCMAVLPNPCDLNLLLVQTGSHERQLRLFDTRTMQREIHSLGFKQESSGEHSAQIKSAWSPDGLHISCGSVDPIIHLFDIRYNGPGPSQSMQAHHKRVFRAEWHRSFPLLISVSSDLHIGLNRFT